MIHCKGQLGTSGELDIDSDKGASQLQTAVSERILHNIGGDAFVTAHRERLSRIGYTA